MGRYGVNSLPSGISGPVGLMGLVHARLSCRFVAWRRDSLGLGE